MPPTGAGWLSGVRSPGCVFGEGTRALLGVRRPEDGHAVLLFVGERLGLGHSGRLPERPQDRLDGQRAVGRDGVGDAPGGGQCLADAEVQRMQVAVTHIDQATDISRGADDVW